MHMARSDPVCMTVVGKAERVGIYTEGVDSHIQYDNSIQQTYNAWGSDNTGYRVIQGGRLVK